MAAAVDEQLVNASSAASLRQTGPSSSSNSHYYRHRDEKTLRGQEAGGAESSEHETSQRADTWWVKTQLKPIASFVVWKVFNLPEDAPCQRGDIGPELVHCLCDQVAKHIGTANSRITTSSRVGDLPPCLVETHVAWHLAAQLDNAFAWLESSLQAQMQCTSYSQDNSSTDFTRNASELWMQLQGAIRGAEIGRRSSQDRVPTAPDDGDRVPTSQKRLHRLSLESTEDFPYLPGQLPSNATSTSTVSMRKADHTDRSTEKLSPRSPGFDAESTTRGMTPPSSPPRKTDSSMPRTTHVNGKDGAPRRTHARDLIEHFLREFFSLIRSNEPLLGRLLVNEILELSLRGDTCRSVEHERISGEKQTKTSCLHAIAAFPLCFQFSAPRSFRDLIEYSGNRGCTSYETEDETHTSLEEIFGGVISHPMLLTSLLLERVREYRIVACEIYKTAMAQVNNFWTGRENLTAKPFFPTTPRYPTLLGSIENDLGLLPPLFNPSRGSRQLLTVMATNQTTEHSSIYSPTFLDSAFRIVLIDDASSLLHLLLRVERYICCTRRTQSLMGISCARHAPGKCPASTTSNFGELGVTCDEDKRFCRCPSHYSFGIEPTESNQETNIHQQFPITRGSIPIPCLRDTDSDGQGVVNDVRPEQETPNLFGQPVMAIDLEGVHLNRHGELCLMQLCLADDVNTAYVVDVHSLGVSRAFHMSTMNGWSLRRILEDETILKLCFDPRNDVDALHHQCDVHLNNAMDLQLAEVACRRSRTLNVSYLKSLPKVLVDSPILTPQQSAFAATIAVEARTMFDNTKQHHVYYRDGHVTSQLAQYDAMCQFSPANPKMPSWDNSSGTLHLALVDRPGTPFISPRQQSFSRVLPYSGNPIQTGVPAWAGCLPYNGWNAAIGGMHPPEQQHQSSRYQAEIVPLPAVGFNNEVPGRAASTRSASDVCSERSPNGEQNTEDIIETSTGLLFSPSSGDSGHLAAVSVTQQATSWSRARTAPMNVRFGQGSDEGVGAPYLPSHRHAGGIAQPSRPSPEQALYNSPLPTNTMSPRRSDHYHCPGYSCDSHGSPHQPKSHHPQQYSQIMASTARPLPIPLAGSRCEACGSCCQLSPDGVALSGVYAPLCSSQYHGAVNFKGTAGSDQSAPRHFQPQESPATHVTDNARIVQRRSDTENPAGFERRPINMTLLIYAAHDVRYMVPLYQHLVSQLSPEWILATLKETDKRCQWWQHPECEIPDSTAPAFYA